MASLEDKYTALLNNIKAIKHTNTGSRVYVSTIDFDKSVNYDVVYDTSASNEISVITAKYDIIKSSIDNYIKITETNREGTGITTKNFKLNSLNFKSVTRLLEGYITNIITTIKNAPAPAPAPKPVPPNPAPKKSTPSPPPVPDVQADIDTMPSSDGPTTNISSLLEIFKKTFQHGTTPLPIPDTVNQDDKDLYLYTIYSFYADNKVYLKEYRKIASRLLFLLQLDNIAWNELTLNLLGEIVQIDNSEIFKFNSCELTYTDTSQWYLKKKLDKFDYLQDTFILGIKRYDKICEIIFTLITSIKTQSAFIYNMIKHNLNISSHPIRDIIEKESYLFKELLDLSNNSSNPNNIYNIQVAIFLYDFCTTNVIDGFTDEHTLYDTIYDQQIIKDKQKADIDYKKTVILKRSKEITTREAADKKASIADQDKLNNINANEDILNISPNFDTSAIDAVEYSDIGDAFSLNVGQKANDRKSKEIVFPGILYDLSEYDNDSDDPAERAAYNNARLHNISINSRRANNSNGSSIEEEPLANRILSSTYETPTLETSDIPFNSDNLFVNNKVLEFSDYVPEDIIVPKILEHDIFQDSDLGNDIVPDSSDLNIENTELPSHNAIDTDVTDALENIQIDIDNTLGAINYSIETFAKEIKDARDLASIHAIILRYRGYGII